MRKPPCKFLFRKKTRIFFEITTVMFKIVETIEIKLFFTQKANLK